MILLNICLSDIPKERIFTSQKTGKKYLNVTVDKRKGTEEHMVYIYDKETKEKTFIGRGKELVFEKRGQQVVVDETIEVADVNDIPF